MKNSYYIYGFLLLMANSLFAQQTTWQSLIANPNLSDYSYYYDQDMDIIGTTDSGVAVLKNTFKPPLSPWRLNGLLLKYDKYGNLTWSKDLGGFAEVYTGFRKVIQTKDKGYLITGGSAGNVIKTDSVGTILWSKAYGKYKAGGLGVPSEQCNFNDLNEVKNGGYILVGYTCNFGNKGGSHGGIGFEDRDVYLVRINTVGGVEWTKTYGVSVWHEWANSIKQTSDDGFIIGGSREEENTGYGLENSAFLLKVNVNGSFQWSKTYSILSENFVSQTTGEGKRSGEFYSVLPAADGGYIATGQHIGSIVNGRSGAWVVKTNSSGAMQWTKHYLSSDNALFEYGGYHVKLHASNDGGYLLNTETGCGATGTITGKECTYLQNIALFKLDGAGEIKWTKTYGTNSEALQASTITKDNGIALCSYDFDSIVNGNYSTSRFTHLIKLDSIGEDASCQTSHLGLYNVPTVVVANYPVTSSLGSYTFTTSMLSTTYTVANYLGVCLNIPVTANVVSDNFCLGDSTVFKNYSNAASYSWNFGDPLSLNNTSSLKSPKHLYQTLGTYTVILTAKDITGNITDDTSITVKVLSRNFIYAGNNVTICSGDSVLLNATGTWAETGGYLNDGWSPRDNLRYYYLDSTYSSPIATTQYKIKAHNTDGFGFGGCDDSSFVTVNVVEPLVPIISGNTSVCAGITTTLSALGVSNYVWSTGETSSVIALNLTTTTSYSITSFNGGCERSTSITINVMPNYTVSAGENVTISKGNSILLNGSASSGITWFPSNGLDCITCLTPNASPSNTTVYYLSSMASNGCKTQDSVIVYVLDCENNIEIANAFSPNGDNVNDMLEVALNNCIVSIDFKIYDRWGNNVFETTDLNPSWDGKCKGNLMDPGVFVYLFTALTTDGEEILRKGNVTLIR